VRFWFLGGLIGSLIPCSFCVVVGWLVLVPNFNALLKEEEFFECWGQGVV